MKSSAGFPKQVSLKEFCQNWIKVRVGFGEKRKSAVATFQIEQKFVLKEKEATTS